MTRDRVIQLAGLFVLAIATTVSGVLLPRINAQTERHALRYTDVAVDGAPPAVAIGTMIGALRGLIVDYYWIKVQIMKERGLYYEVMHDAELITKLQPRFASVWAFHGHNMAYNISVATSTPEERWEWVRQGIDLVRNEGLRYNPNDLVLYKELSFWFSHKIDGYTDDAHPFYKREFAREWHYLLGEPPDDWDERIAWIKAIADAPNTLDDLEERTPGVKALVERIRNDIGRLAADTGFQVEDDLLSLNGEWTSLTQSPRAELLGVRDQFRQSNPIADAFDRLLTEVGDTEEWKALLAHLRKRALADDYNMSAQTMYEFTRDLGPIDWRHAQSHALYWSRVGSLVAERRQANDDDVYKILNNDRIQLQSMQGLARFGRMHFDPLSADIPTRLPDRRWIDPIVPEFERLYLKHYDTRGAGGESFIGFLQNFTGSAIREMYRMGYKTKALELMAVLDDYFGRGADPPNNKWIPTMQNLEVFVWRETLDEYVNQPHLAQSDVFAALYNGFLNGVVYESPELLDEAREFAQEVTEIYRTEHAFTTRLNTERMTSLVSQLETMELGVAYSIMIDRTIPLEQRMAFWRKIDEFYPGLRPWVYDDIRPAMVTELENTVFGQQFTIDDVLPEPIGMNQIRQMLARDEQSAMVARRELRGRAATLRQGQ